MSDWYVKYGRDEYFAPRFSRRSSVVRVELRMRTGTLKNRAYTSAPSKIHTGGSQRRKCFLVGVRTVFLSPLGEIVLLVLGRQLVDVPNEREPWRTGR